MYTPIGMGAATVTGGGATGWDEQEFRSLIPPCYSQAFDPCWKDKPNNYPNCARIDELYKTNKERAATIVDDDLPYCSPCVSGDVLLPPDPGGAEAEEGKKFSLGEAAIYASVAGLVGLGLGYVLGS